MACARAVLDGPFQDQVRLHIELVVTRVRRQLRPAHKVCADEREVRTGQNLVHEGQPVVELVVAQRARIKAQRAHGLVHGQLLRAGDGADGGLVVGQCGALDGVTVVHQQRVGKLLAGRAHQRCRALKAVAFVFGQLEVVVAAHVEVQVGGLQHGQRGRGARVAAGVVAAAAAGSQRRGQRHHAPCSHTA